MHLRQQGYAYSICGSFTKNKERIKRLKKLETKYIFIKTCFQHDMTYGYFKDLTRRTTSEKTLDDKAFNIAQNSKYDGYQRVLASMV